MQQLRTTVMKLLKDVDWSVAHSAMLLGGLARRPVWKDGTYYFIEKESGRLMLSVAGGPPIPYGEPDAQEIDAKNWQVLRPSTREELPAPVLAEVEAKEAEIREQMHRAQQAELQGAADVAFEAASVADEATTEGKGFAEAMEVVLSGDGAAWRDVPGFPVLRLVVAPSILTKPAEGRAVMYEVEHGALQLYRPEPEDLVAYDWVVAE